MPSDTVETRPSTFRPGDPRARAAGIKSGQVRKQRNAERAEKERADRALVDRFLDINLDTADLGPAALATLSLTIKRLAAGTIPIRNGAEAAAVMDKLHQIGRLEAGQVTALTANVTLQLDDDERRERLARARASIDAASSVAGLHNVATPQVSAPSPADADAGTPPLPMDERAQESDR